MAANFLHGVETIEIQKGARSIKVVKSAVIGLVGIAPEGEANHPILVTSEKDAAQFGAQVPGFSIPQSLDAIFKQGAGTVIVVNVFKEDEHTLLVEDESHQITNGKTKLANAPIGDIEIKEGGNPTSYQKNVDYSIDAFGNFKTIGSGISEGATLTFNYKKLNDAAITASVINGSIDSGTGVRTGFKCFELSFNMFGFTPKILIAPTFSDAPAVSANMISLAESLKAIAYIDAPYGTTVSDAIEARGPLGTIGFNTSSKRAELLYPHLKVSNPDPAETGELLFPYSAFLAGVRAAVDNDEGYWFSDSNHEIKGIIGVERQITAGISDANTESNLLNEAGITTLFNSFGSGIRVWGNRSASYPSYTGPDNFVCVRRTADIIHESVEQACLQFIDRPITQGWIDSVRESVNSFLRTLQGRGAIIDGVCKYNPDDNPAVELAQGHVTFTIDFMPPTPAERITFNSFINIEYLNNLA